MWRMEFFITATVMKKPHFAQGFVWEFLLSPGNKKSHTSHKASCGKFYCYAAIKKATLRTRLRVALKFLKLTAFVNEILWWAHRDSLARCEHRLRGIRDDLTTLHLSNLLVVEPWGRVLVRFVRTKKIKPRCGLYFWWAHRDSNPGPTD